MDHIIESDHRNKILILVPVYSNTNQTLYQGDVGKKSPLYTGI